MTTLFIRHPAKAEVDSAAPGTMPACQFALAGDGGSLLQQGAAALGGLTDLVVGARQVVLIVAAADVTLLRVQVPPLSAARLKAALPNLVEEQLLGDPADCVLVSAPVQGSETERMVAVVQRGWLEVLVKALVAQGAHSIAVLPAQLCLPHQAGTQSAVLTNTAGGLELTLRSSQYEGMGMDLAADPLDALTTLHALAGEAPLTLHVASAQLAQYRALLDSHPLLAASITLGPDQWEHWVANARGAAPDLLPGLGALGQQNRNWARWKWPLRIALVAVLVNIVALQVEWWRMKREADTVKLGMLQTFKAAFPAETVILDPLAQMRSKVAAAKSGAGAAGGDDFNAMSAALGEALGGSGRKVELTGLDYRDKALQAKFKPDAVDPAATAQIKDALARRGIALTEAAAGVWQLRANPQGAKP